MWKPGPLRQAAVALVQAGLAEMDAGRDYFGPDNVPDTVQYGGQGVCGSAVHALRTAGVIKDYWGPYYPNGRRKSLRESANGRKVSLYSLTRRGMAVAFLRKHGVPVESRQLEMAI